MNAAQEKRLAAALEHAQAEALALAFDADASIIMRLETRMERREDGSKVIRFEWEVGTRNG